MTNPLRVIIEKMGLTPERASAMLRVHPVRLESILRDEPPELVQAVFQILDGLGIRLRVPMEAGSIWFDQAAITALLANTQWRARQGWSPLPRTRGELWRWVDQQHHKGLTYGQILAKAHDEFIPTAKGRREWRRSTIGQMVWRTGKRYDQLPIGAGPEFLEVFRRHVAERLWVRLVEPFDPFALVRYEFAWRYADGRLWVGPQRPMPVALWRWMLNAATGIGWFLSYQWGVSYGKEVQATGAQVRGRVAEPDPQAVAGRDGGGRDVSGMCQVEPHRGTSPGVPGEAPGETGDPRCVDEGATEDGD